MMLRILFERKFNFLDALLISVCYELASQGRWWLALAIFLIGIPISVWGENKAGVPK